MTMKNKGTDMRVAESGMFAVCQSPLGTSPYLISQGETAWIQTTKKAAVARTKSTHVSRFGSFVPTVICPPFLWYDTAGPRASACTVDFAHGSRPRRRPLSAQEFSIFFIRLQS